MKKSTTQLSWNLNPPPRQRSLQGVHKLIYVFTKPPTDAWTEEILLEKSADLELLIILIGKFHQKYDLKINLFHQAKKTKGKITFRGLQFDRSEVNFRGKNFLPGKCAQSQTMLKYDSLLLSPYCKTRTIPSLEIIANDVVAGHSATIGRPDEDVLFYLQSRGLSLRDSRIMLAKSFLAGASNAFSGLELSEREQLQAKLLDLLDK